MKNTYIEKNIVDTDRIVRMSADDDDPVEVVEAGKETEDSESDDDISDMDLLELLSQMKEMMDDTDVDDDDDDDDDNDDDNSVNMDADDYHNKAVSYARRSMYSKAARICMEGLEKFPLNVDLLADTITYSKDAGDMEQAEKYYSILKNKVPFKRWNWRAFTFSFDYLLEADPEANEEECRLLVENYRRYLPYEERADMAESELESALGNAEESMTVLRNALHSRSNSSQCALRLADMLMDRGLYEDVIETANYGIAASAEAQPSINVPYLYYLRALSKDHLLHRKECAGEEITEAEVSALKEEYELLISEFKEILHYSHNIKNRMKMLRFIKTA